MKKTQAQNPYQYGHHDDPLQLGNLIEAISTSALSEPKKLAYLYLIAEGSFSDITLQKLREDVAQAGKALEVQIDSKRKKLLEADRKIQQLEAEIARLTPKAVEEGEKNLQIFVHAVAKRHEAEQKTSTERKVKALRKKITKA